MNYSANGTIFHTQLFLSYHYETKFEDKSLLFYLEDNLIAVLAVCKEENIFFSHKGTSGGGPVIHNKYIQNIKILKEIISAIDYYYGKQIEYFLSESVFSLISTHPLIELLQEGKKITNEKSAYFNLENATQITRKRLITGINSVLKSNIKFDIANNENDYIEFYSIIQSNLSRYKTKPTHSLEEFLKLKQILNTNQFLFLAKHNDVILAGLWVIKVNSFAWHTQYIAKDYSINQNYILQTLILELKKKALQNNQKILSLGSCNGGIDATFSSSLCEFKTNLGTEICFRTKISIY